jgi:hypothetical protein
MLNRLLILIAILLLAISASADYIEVRQLELPAGDIKLLEIDCGAGFLEILGVAGLDKIEVEAEIILENFDDDEAEDFMDRFMELELRDRGSKAWLISNFEYEGPIRSLFSFNGNKLINLTVRMPANIALEIEDGSGYIAIEDINNEIDLDDGSGEITIENCTGEIRLEDGSGDIEISKIEGLVEIDDGSGSIRANEINGDLTLDDGSGNIRIRNVVGDIDIDDGSGDMSIRDIDGVVVVDDGSGDIKINGVTQDVRIVDSGSGDCDIANVDGKVRGDVDDF